MLELNTVQFGVLRLEYFMSENEEPKHNWKVLTTGDVLVGYLHDCNGIGGYIGDDAFMEQTNDFDKLCELAKQDLEERSKCT